MESNHSWWV